MRDEKILEFTTESGGDRLDRLLATQAPDGVSRSALQKLIDAGAVTVNGVVVRSSYRTRPGDSVVAHIPSSARAAEPLAESVPLDIVYEDEHLLVIVKPAGMVVHPAAGHWSGTLVNALLAHEPEIEDEGQPDRPGIVHRLDKETSGLIIVAKSQRIRAMLQAAFKEHRVRKKYFALVEGRVGPSHALINAALGRDPRRRKRISVTADGRPALSEYTVLERFERHSYLEVELHTGRTHQIRVHLAYTGHPVVGDSVYGFRRQRTSLGRHFLHAAELWFEHPVTGESMHFRAPLPAELEAVLEGLRDGNQT